VVGLFADGAGSMEQRSAEIEQTASTLRQTIAHAAVWDDSCEQDAVRFAEALIGSDMPRTEMLRRLRAEGLSRRGAKRLLADARRAARERKRAEQEQELAGATPVCPHCLSQLSPGDHFCRHCSAPVTVHASIDPLGQVYSAGRAYRQAVSKPSRRIIVVGMWLIFGPVALSLLFGVFLALSSLGVFGSEGPFSGIHSAGLVYDLLALGVMLIFIGLYLAILWKMMARRRRFAKGNSPGQGQRSE